MKKSVCYFFFRPHPPEFWQYTNLCSCWLYNYCISFKNIRGFFYFFMIKKKRKGQLHPPPISPSAENIPSYYQLWLFPSRQRGACVHQHSSVFCLHIFWQTACRYRVRRCFPPFFIYFFFLFFFFLLINLMEEKSEFYLKSI